MAFPRRRAVLLASLALPGCAFVNPIGFWDITELSVSIDGGDSHAQIDYGTFEVVEASGSESATAYVRYYPVATEEGVEFAPQTTPIESNGPWGELADEDGEGLQGIRLFGFYTGELYVDRYRGPVMTLAGEGMWAGTLSGVEETTPVELVLELER